MVPGPQDEPSGDDGADERPVPPAAGRDGTELPAGAGDDPPSLELPSEPEAELRLELPPGVDPPQEDRPIEWLPEDPDEGPVAELELPGGAEPTGGPDAGAGPSDVVLPPGAGWSRDDPRGREPAEPVPAIELPAGVDPVQVAPVATGGGDRGRGALVGAGIALLAAGGLAAALLTGGGADPVATSAATATSTAPPATSAEATTAKQAAGGATSTTPAPRTPAAPVALVSTELPDTLATALPEPARGAGRTEALGAACAGEAAAAVVARRIGTAPCRLVRVADATVRVTVLLAPGGGCTTLAEARRLAVRAREAGPSGERPDGLAAVAVRRTASGPCVPVNRQTLTSGRHPLTQVAVLAARPAERRSARVRALARELRALEASTPVEELVLRRPLG